MLTNLQEMSMTLDVQDIRNAGLMHLNQTHFVKAGERSLLEKAGIYEGDLLQSVQSRFR